MERLLHYDVVVAGGGSAGVAAAIGAAQTGAKTLLVERNPYLGGEATHSNIISYCGFYTRGSQPDLVVGGVGAMLLAKIEKLGETTAPVISITGNNIIPVDPETVKFALDQLLEESSADLLLHCRVIGVRTEKRRIIAIECIDDEERFFVEADSFVDATGESALTYLAGCETVRGDENGICQVSTMAMRIDRVGKNADISLAGLEKAVNAGKVAGISHLTKDKGGIIRKGDDDIIVLLIPSYAHNDLHCNTLTAAEMDTRRQAQSYMKAFRQFMPGMEQARLIQTGPKIGIREGRRTVGKHIITGEEVLSLSKTPEVVARCGWSPEIHKSADIMDDYIKLPDNTYFEIPIGALKARDIDNLWCGGRTISTDHTSYGAVRVMGTGFATGHGAGVAAALSKGRPEYDLKSIQAELIRQGALL